MSMNYWIKQSVDQPAFPEMEWSKPENKRHAGKLLIMGGNLQGFSEPATAFSGAQQAGIGSMRVLLPDSIRKTVSVFMPEADFAPSTPSGSFATQSLDTLLEHGSWADGVLLAGDFGKNSETAVLIESFLSKYNGLLGLTGDSLEYFIENPNSLLGRAKTVAIMTFAQTQKMITNTKFKTPVSSSMDLMYLVEALHKFSDTYHFNLITTHQNAVVISSKGRVSTTSSINLGQVSNVIVAAQAMTWWIQHPAKPFEALTTAVIV